MRRVGHHGVVRVCFGGGRAAGGEEWHAVEKTSSAAQSAAAGASARHVRGLHAGAERSY